MKIFSNCCIILSLCFSGLCLGQNLKSVPIISSDGKPLVQAVLVDISYDECCLNCDVEPPDEFSKELKKFLSQGGMLKVDNKVFLDRACIGDEYAGIWLSNDINEEVWPAIINYTGKKFSFNIKMKDAVFVTAYSEAIHAKVASKVCDLSKANFGFTELERIDSGISSNKYVASDVLRRFTTPLNILEQKTIDEHPFLELLQQSLLQNKRELLKVHTLNGVRRVTGSFSHESDSNRLFTAIDSLQQNGIFLHGVIAGKDSTIAFLGDRNLTSFKVFFFYKVGEVWHISVFPDVNYYDRKTDSFLRFGEGSILILNHFFNKSLVK